MATKTDSGAEFLEQLAERYPDIDWAIERDYLTKKHLLIAVRNGQQVIVICKDLTQMVNLLENGGTNKIAEKLRG